MNINSSNLEFACKIIKSISGISISYEKRYLLETRLITLAKAHNYNSVDELISYIKLTQSKDLIMQMIELMTTNETSFFRDRVPFDILKSEIIPNLLLKKTDQKIKIWCAGCSSGQEPYSIAMMLKENFPDKILFFSILATDINNRILKKAQKGIYSQFEVQRGLPTYLLQKYFTQINKEWQLSNDIINLVQFKSLNLINDINFSEKFDIIFCRNVLIYFDLEKKMLVLSSLKKNLHSHGVLFLGSSETIINVNHEYNIYNINYAGIYT